MLRPKIDLYKEFENEKTLLRLKNSPPPITFPIVHVLKTRFAALMQNKLHVFVARFMEALPG